MPKRSQTEPLQVGIAWFDREQWQRLTEVVPDRDELDDTFEQWERSAIRAIKKFKRSGQRIEKVPINVEELLAWCKSNDMVPDGKSRAQFVSTILQQKYGSKS